MSNSFPMVQLSEVLTQYKEYIQAPEPKIYPKLSVKLYGKGVVLDNPTAGSSLKMQQHQIAKSSQVILSEIWGKKGAIGIVPLEGNGALCTSHFFLFDINYDKIEPAYLQAIFTANYLEDQLGSEAKGTTGYAAVRPKHLLTAYIPLPPLTEQLRIVARIEELASRIEEARGLRRGAVEERDALISSLLKSAYEEAAKVADGTERLDDVCALITDGTHITPTYVPSGIPFLSVKDITTGVIKFDSVKYITPEEHVILTKRCKPERDDILLTKVGTTGFAKVIDVDEEFSIFVSLALLKLDKARLQPNFTEYMLNSPQLKEFSAQGTRGVGNKNLVLKFIREFPMPVPPLSEQIRIVAYINNIYAKVDALKQLQAETSAELDALLPSVLDKAFMGEL